MTFELYSYRFRMAAREPISFSRSAAANTLRGGFGGALRRVTCSLSCPGRNGANIRDCDQRQSCAYAQIFEPAARDSSPSGFADLPRPFVFRAAHLDGAAFEAGEQFWFGVNVFETRKPLLSYFERAFAQLDRTELLSVEPADSEPISIPLAPASTSVHRLRVEFRTPTELKCGKTLADGPDFDVLFTRARDRVATLRSLYGQGPLDIDFRGLGERARTVRLSRCQLREVDVRRRSSRTGQVHSIGGFTGVAEYEGDISEFFPFLEVARWTGVGRQCVWGKGEIHASVI